MRFDLSGLEAFGYSGPLSVSPVFVGLWIGVPPVL